MPITGLQKTGESAAAPFKHGAPGLRFESLSRIIDTNAIADVAVAPPACPTDKTGLTDGYQLFTYSLTTDAASSLSIWAKGELKASDRVVLYQFAWYKDILNPDGTVDARCGAGVMLALKISSLQANLSLELPTLAATAQLGQSSITYKINTFGLSGNAIDESIPSASAIGKFNTESYAALMLSISKIQDSYKAPAGQLLVTPRIIAQSYPASTQGFDTTVAVQAFSLRQIASGKNCKEAKAVVPDKDANILSIIESTYTSISGKGCGAFSAAPSPAIQTKANELLRRYGLLEK